MCFLHMKQDKNNCWCMIGRHSWQRIKYFRSISNHVFVLFNMQVLRFGMPILNTTVGCNRTFEVFSRHHFDHNLVWSLLFQRWGLNQAPVKVLQTRVLFWLSGHWSLLSLSQYYLSIDLHFVLQFSPTASAPIDPASRVKWLHPNHPVNRYDLPVLVQHQIIFWVKNL